MHQQVEIFWFKRDLRTFDNTPLSMAVKDNPVIPLYIFEPNLWRQPDLSYRHYVFLKNALRHLNNELENLGSGLLIRVGSARDILAQLCSNFKVARLWSHQETWNLWTYERDIEVRKWSRSVGLEWCEVANNGVVRRLNNRNGWSRQWHNTMSGLITPQPKKFCSVRLKSDKIPCASKLDLETNQTISGKLESRTQALKTLDSFLKSRGCNYKFEMSSPITAESACSRLSPHLAFGQLSIREVFQATEKRRREINLIDRNFAKSLKSFQSRLRWHCHFIQKLEDQPSIETNALHSAFENLRPPSCDVTILRAWKIGMTGFPMVDACMRYLNENGWLNFRMRAMLVSFASYHLWLDWRITSRHLARQFLDYEPGIHYSQIQMQSGTTGMNSVRIYNPIKQGLDHDPDGKFIRKWVPELKDIPNQFVHQPWLFADANISYPKPIVDEKLARTAAQEKIYSLKKQIKNSEETASLIQKHASRLNRRPRKKLKASIPVKQQLSLDL